MKFLLNVPFVFALVMFVGKLKMLKSKMVCLFCFCLTTCASLSCQEQKADVSKGQKTLAFQTKVEKKVEKKMPVLSVKKPRTEKAEAEKLEEVDSKEVDKTEAAEAAEAEAAPAGIGLAYSDSESES